MKNQLLILLSMLLMTACNQGSVESPEAAVTNEPDEVAQGSDPYRLDPNVQPSFQQLTFKMDPAQADYSGSTLIELNIVSATNTIRLHASEIDITSVQLSNAQQEFEVTHEAGEHGIVSLGAAESLEAGAYTLRIEFSNDFNTNGEAINRTDHEGDSYVFSQFEAIHARESFPCFDEPGYKYPWQLTISVPREVTAVTNTPVDSISAADGWITTVFKQTPALPSYLIAVAIGPFEFVDIPGMSIPGRVVTPRGMSALAKEAVETTPAILASLEDYFSEPYPFAKLDLIATYQAFSGAMEHPGAITYSDHILLLDETASEQQKMSLARITAHELAHQWFGNLVTMEWWDDLWLNESFADWMGDKIVERVHPEAGGDLMQLRTVFQIMDVDARETTKPIRHKFKATDNFADGVTLSYYKGKSVINMFERSIGEQPFREGVIRYLQKYSRKNAEADEFWASMNLGAEYDFAAALATFIDFEGIPLISVNEAENGAYQFSQSRYVSGGHDLEDPAWVIPVTYKYKMGDAVLEGSLLLDEPAKTVIFDKDVQWILPNGNQQGYYRWQVPEDMLTAMSADAAADLTVRERMGLVSNLWALLSSYNVDGENFVASIHNLSSDTDASVIAALLDQLQNIETTFVTDELKPAFANYIQATLKPTLERIGGTDVPDESTQQARLRPNILHWLADSGADGDARTYISDYVEKFLAGEIPSSSLVELSLHNLALRGDQALLDKYISLLESATSPGERLRYLRAIGSFLEPDLVDQVFVYILANDLNPNDIGNLIIRMAGMPENEEAALKWLMTNDEYLRERMPPGMMARIPYFTSACSEENLDTIRAFYGDESRASPGIETALAQSEAGTRTCAKLRQREQASVARYLNTF